MGVNKNFVVRHGFESSTNLILADADTRKVGVGTTNPKFTLDVSGGIGATDSKFSGISTFNDLVIEGTLNAGGVSVGETGQYLRSTYAGVEWVSFPTLRTVQTYIATEGQLVFPFVHTPNEIDVYINGVKLSTTEYSDSSIDVTLFNPAFSGDTVEIIGYGLIGTGTASTTGISGITVLDEGIPIGIVDAITSINFVGGDVQAVGTGAGVTVTINPTDLSYIEGDARITGILTVGSSSVVINGPANSVDAGTITTKELIVTGESYSTQDLLKTVDRPVGIGSTEIILNDVNDILVNDAITVAGILTAVTIVGFETVGVDSYNQTFLLTTTNINVAIGSTVIGVANTTGVSIGSSLTIIDYYDNVPVVGFATVSIVESPGFINAVLIGPGFALTTVVPVNSVVGFSSVISQRDAVLIGTASTSSVGISSGSSALIQRFAASNSNLNVTGIVTATGGFISVGNTTPIQISLIGNELTFTAVGIGFTTLTLF
jgi:hypothetical protein